jgi:hypothetical protein
MDGWVNGEMEIDGIVNGLMDGWMNEWMDR